MNRGRHHPLAMVIATPALVLGLLLASGATSLPAAAATATAGMSDVKTVALVLRFSAGTYTGYRFDGSGSVTARRPATLPRTSSAPAVRSGMRGGRRYYAVSAGIWAGYWMPAGSGIATVAAGASTPAPVPAAASASPSAAVAAPVAGQPAAFTYPAPGGTSVQHVAEHAVSWNAGGSRPSRLILTELWAPAVDGACGNVAWKTAWSRLNVTSPAQVTGYALNTCYRYSLSLRGATVAVSGALLVTAGSFTMNLYDAAGVRYQDPDYTACVAASTLMMLNFTARKGAPGSGFQWSVSTSYAMQETALGWDRAHMTQVTSHAGVDATGWRNGLNHFGWGSHTNVDTMVYRITAATSYQVAVKGIVRAMARFRKPVGIMGWAGGHAQIVNGYRVVGLDPATSDTFSVLAVYLTDPLASDQMRNTSISTSAFGSGSLKYRFRPYAYTDSPYDDPDLPGSRAAYLSWYGRWVFVGPVR